MAPKETFIPPSSLGIKPPARRSGSLSSHMWLEDKKDTDGAEGLWRIHDGIYDFTDFIDKHPGGSMWLNLSKGTDITEAFEVHHISIGPEQMLQKFFIRNAKKPRNAPFTFKENGFYRSLKREVREILPSLPKQSARISNFLIDAIFVCLFFLATLGVKYWNYFLVVLSGNFLALLSIAAHNYFHRKDNFRMYYFHFCGMQVRDWRVSHVLSHHLHTNTIDDLEISMMEPFLNYMPVEKKTIDKIKQYMVAPFMWMSTFHRQLISKFVEICKGNKENYDLYDLIPCILPIFMYIFGGQSLWHTFLIWNLMLLVGSTHFFFVGLHAAHHHPDIFHDGDTPRAVEDYDWGLSQLDAVMDRKEITGSHFLVLTNFGDHALHHLFPTLDHGTLELLYPTFKKVLDQFNANLRMVSQLDTIVGGFQQLNKTKPNPSPPDLHKYKFDKNLKDI